MQTRFRLSQIALATVLGLGAGAATAADQPITQDDFIKGTISISWDTRLPKNQEDGLTKAGVPDVYAMDATVGTTFYKGKITCLPFIFSKHIGRVIQEGSCQYDIDLGVINPHDLSQRRVVGKLAGTKPIDRSGHSNLTGANLRFEVQTIGSAKGFTSPYSGTLIGKAAKANTTLSELVSAAEKKTATVTRMLGGKQISVTLGNVDPVTFQSVSLPAGPSSNYPEAVMDGQFVYSYETDNWFPTLTATTGGNKDKFGGGMKWVEGDDGGRYELNILINEDQGPQGESAAFADAQGEDAFFMNDPGKATIKGTISIKDTHTAGVELAIHSDVGYHIGLQAVTAQQAQVFWKAMLLIPEQMYGE